MRVHTFSLITVAALAAPALTAGCAGDAPPPSGPQDAPPGQQLDASGQQLDAPSGPRFSFFITSTGGPNGGDFRATPADPDGLAGADAFCRTKATAADPTSANRMWRAYLSTAAVDARDRIGTGPWWNKNLVMVATSVANLHDAAANALNKVNSVDETGATVNGTGDNPNQHDILTGSLANGTKAAETCNNWTSSAATGVTAAVGHHDRMGGGNGTSWNAAHASGGCSAAAFVATGGRGSFYCFAAD